MAYYIVSWDCVDVDAACEVIGYGKTASRDVMIRVPWTPFFYVQVPQKNQISELSAKAFMMVLLENTRGIVREKSRLVSKKPFVGFRNGEESYFVQVVFASLESWRRAKYSLGSQYDLYEAALDPLIKFFHVSGVRACGWTRVTGGTELSRDDSKRLSKSHVSEVKVGTFRDIESITDMDTQAPPLIVCSWDIEAYSKSGAFPDADKPSDKIITIGAAYVKFGSDVPYKKTVHVLGTANTIQGVEVYTYEKEEDLITGFMQETIRERTDFLLAWNSYGFDHSYIDGRSVTLIDYTTGESLVNMKVWGKTTSDECGKIMEKRLASSAYGDNNYRYHNIPGVISVDALQIFRKETKHDSYTLDNIAKTYLDISKIDLKPWELFQKYEEEDPAGRTDIAEYCVRDCELPIMLMNKMNMFEGLIEFSKVTGVPISWLLLRGQQIRVYSLIAKVAREKGFVIPDMKGEDSEGDGFTGAVVLDPFTGGYTEDIVCAMDFASLYPSIMMAHTMCGSTLVLDDRYRYIPGIDYYEVEAAPGMKVTFAQTTDNVIPDLLYSLKRMRKEAKRDMAEADDDFTKGLMNSRQLAYKLVMNSLYGALGSNHGLLCGLKKISMSVTATGRWMINETKRLVETLNPGSRVIYGDSVAAYTPIYVKREGDSTLTTFEALASSLTWQPRDDGKEYAYCPGLETWSDSGWTRVETVIRHAHQGPLIRVATHTGVVDVTQDHSLLLDTGEMVSPRDVGLGTRLLHAPGPCIHRVNKQVMKEFIEGFYDADGEKSQNLRMDQKNQISAAHLYKIFIDCGYNVSITTREDKPHIFRLTASYQKLGRDPTSIKKKYSIPYTGYVYDFTTANGHFSAGLGDLVVHNTDSVLCILDCGQENRQNLKVHFEVAEDLAAQITKHFLPPHELEMEKAYFPYLLVTKKRYAGLMYERFDATPKIDIKGLQLVRRDSPKIVKRVSRSMLEILLYKRSFDLAMEFVQQEIVNMLNGNVPFDEFIMSKTLRSNYKNQNLPHLIVSKKRRERGGTPFHSGERVPFVYCLSNTDMDLGVSQRAEDAEYARDNNLKIDVLYYIQNQLLTPLVTLLQLQFKHAQSDILKHPDIASKMVALQAQTLELSKMSKRVRTNVANKQREITSFFKRDYR